MIIKYKTFKEFLMSKHSKEYPWILDDELPDEFENWLYHSELSIDDMIKYADEYTVIQEQKIKREIISKFILKKKGEDIEALNTYEISQATGIDIKEVWNIMNEFKKEGKVKEIEI